MNSIGSHPGARRVIFAIFVGIRIERQSIVHIHSLHSLYSQQDRLICRLPFIFVLLLLSMADKMRFSRMFVESSRGDIDQIRSDPIGAAGSLGPCPCCYVNNTQDPSARWALANRGLSRPNPSIGLGVRAPNRKLHRQAATNRVAAALQNLFPSRDLSARARAHLDSWDEPAREKVDQMTARGLDLVVGVEILYEMEICCELVSISQGETRMSFACPWAFTWLRDATF